MKYLKLFEAEEKKDIDLFGSINNKFSDITETMIDSNHYLNNMFKDKYIVIYQDSQNGLFSMPWFIKCLGTNINIKCSTYEGFDDQKLSITMFKYRKNEKITSINVNMLIADIKIYFLDDLIKNDLKKFANMWRYKNKILLDMEEWIEKNQDILKAIEIGMI